MAKKIYAVRKGIKTGLFDTWEECQEQIKGFSGAEFKSFKTVEEANDYLKGNKPEVLLYVTSSTDVAYAYVDGSYNSETKEYSYGAILVHNNEETEYSGKGTDSSLADMRNVAGEILGAELMMRKCVELGVKRLDLYYDYEGIEKWCNGAWKAKKIGTQSYRDYYNSIKSMLQVNFHKVQAHTGVELNERVDRLAKKALGII